MSALPAPPPGRFDDPQELPIVRIGLDEDRVVAETIAVLATSRETFARGGMLVRVVADESVHRRRVHRADSAPVIRPHTPATLRLELARLLRFERARKVDGELRWQLSTPTPTLLAQLLDSGAWPGVRPLEGVASAPRLREDGSVAQEPGYDAESAHVLAFDADGFPRIPDDLSKADALKARVALLDVVRDFPFADDADRSAWLAFVLTLCARPAIAGPCPLFTFTANVRGAGKSRLVDVASLIATGRIASRATQPTDDAEAGKILTSIVLAGDELVLFDNVTRPLGGGKLDALLTGERWKDRTLGTNTTIDVPIRVVLAATGNNLELSGDTLRRALPVRLDSPLESPEDRHDFAVSDLLAHVRTERPRLVAAALTMLRAWYVAGGPHASVRPWGSFEAWARVIPHVLAYADLPDPQATRLELAGDDPQLRALGVVLEGWRRLEIQCGSKQGITIRQALERLYPPGQGAASDDGNEDLREALELLAPGKGPIRVSTHALGNAFRRARRRVLSHRQLVQSDTAKGGVVRWTVRDMP